MHRFLTFLHAILFFMACSRHGLFELIFCVTRHVICFWIEMLFTTKLKVFMQRLNGLIYENEQVVLFLSTLMIPEPEKIPFASHCCHYF